MIIKYIYSYRRINDSGYCRSTSVRHETNHIYLCDNIIGDKDYTFTL